MDDKRWIELAKRRKQDKYFGIISLLIALMMVFFTLKNIGWLLTFIVVAVILYYWIDVEQMLEDSKAINRTQKIIFIILGIVYELTSIIFAFINLDYLLLAFGIVSAGYLGFKINTVFRKDKVEGLRYKNFIGSYSHGPLLRNTNVANAIVKMILERHKERTANEVESV